jgi:hypothetical protein
MCLALLEVKAVSMDVVKRYDLYNSTTEPGQEEMKSSRDFHPKAN